MKISDVLIDNIMYFSIHFLYVGHRINTNRNWLQATKGDVDHFGLTSHVPLYLYKLIAANTVYNNFDLPKDLLNQCREQTD